MDDELEHIDAREGYDLWAPGYDEYDNPLIALEEPIVADLVGPVSGLRVADIGCGTGRHALRLAAAGARVTGVDFSAGMLGVLGRRAGGGSVEIVAHDLTRGLPLPSASFDLVLCCLVIEHLPDLDRTVSELGRICRAGGHVVISDFHPEMTRRGMNARFHDPAGGPKYQIGGYHRPVSAYVMAAVRAGLRIEQIAEHVMDEKTAAASRSALKYVGLPLLLTMKLRAERARS